jgi:hypothetical protein
MAHLGVSTVMGVCMLIYNGNLMKMDDLGPILGNLYLYAIELHDAEFPEALGKHVDMPKNSILICFSGLRHGHIPAFVGTWGQIGGLPQDASMLLQELLHSVSRNYSHKFQAILYTRFFQAVPRIV